METQELDYLSQETFEKEMRRIFQGCWYAIGFASDVPNHNDYFLAHVGGKEVIVQNIEGRIRAFSNVCPHRFSAIHTERRGNRSLVCPYHLWSFNAEGVPRFPGTTDAACLQAQGDRLRLETWRVGTVGNVIYVCLDAAAPALEDYLGPSRAWIEEVSLACGYEFKSFQSDIRANWKVIMNNTIEFYHAYSVHPKTFRPMIHAPLEAMQLLPAQAPNIHYAMPMKESDATMDRMDRLFGRLLKRPAGLQMQCYEHLYSFPNLTVGHVNGRCFSFFQYEPLAPDLTRLTARMWMPAALNGNQASVQALCAGFEEKLTPFIVDLAEEDRGICETVQRGLKSRPAGWTTQFTGAEHLVVQFQREYRRLMGL